MHREYTEVHRDWITKPKSGVGVASNISSQRRGMMAWMTVSPSDPREIRQIQHQIIGFRRSVTTSLLRTETVTIKPTNNGYNSSGLWWLHTKYLRCCELAILALSRKELGDMASCHGKWKFCLSKFWAAFACRATKSPESSHWIVSLWLQIQHWIPTYVHCMYWKTNFADIVVLHCIPKCEFLLFLFSLEISPPCLGSCLFLRAKTGIIGPQTIVLRHVVIWFLPTHLFFPFLTWRNQRSFPLSLAKVTLVLFSSSGVTLKLCADLALRDGFSSRTNDDCVGTACSSWWLAQLCREDILGRGDFFRLLDRGVLSMMEGRSLLPHQSCTITACPLLLCRPCQLTRHLQFISSGPCQRICCYLQRAALKLLGRCSFSWLTLPATWGNCLVPWLWQPLHALVFGGCFHLCGKCSSGTYAWDKRVPPAPALSGTRSTRGTACQETGNRNKWRRTPLLLSTETIFGATILRVVHSPGIPHPDISAHLPHLLSALLGFQLQIIPIKPLQWFFYALSVLYTQCHQHLLFVKQ